MNFRAPVEYQRGEQARKGGRDSKAKFKDRKVWTVAVGRRSASARFQIRRSPGECTSIQIYRRRVHCTHACPRLRDSSAFQRSERCIIIGASALSIRGNPENNPKKSGFHGFTTPFYEFTSAPRQPRLFPSLPFSSLLPSLLDIPLPFEQRLIYLFLSGNSRPNTRAPRRFMDRFMSITALFNFLVDFTGASRK